MHPLLRRIKSNHPIGKGDAKSLKYWHVNSVQSFPFPYSSSRSRSVPGVATERNILWLGFQIILTVEAQDAYLHYELTKNKIND